MRKERDWPQAASTSAMRQREMVATVRIDGDDEPFADGGDLGVGVVHGAHEQEIEVFEGGVAVGGVLVFFDVVDEEVPSMVGEEGAEGFDHEGVRGLTPMMRVACVFSIWPLSAWRR